MCACTRGNDGPHGGLWVELSRDQSGSRVLPDDRHQLGSMELNGGPDEDRPQIKFEGA